MFEKMETENKDFLKEELTNHEGTKKGRNTSFLDFVPRQEKLDFQDKIKSEVRPYLQNIVEKLRGKIKSAIEFPADAYLSNLRNSWQEHNQIAKNISDFLRVVHDRSGITLGPIQLEQAIGLLEKAIHSDNEKNVYSGGLKKKIEAEAIRIKDRYNLSDEEYLMTLTPSEGNFYEAYRYDHLKFFFANKNGENIGKSELIEKYHGEDEGLLNSRMETFGFEKESIEALTNELEKYLKRHKDFVIRKGYLMLEKPDIKTLDKLVSFDNMEEFQWGYSLMGMPDYLLRKLLYTELVRAKFLNKNQPLLSVDENELLELSKKLKEKREEHFQMHIPNVQQHWDSCGAACVLSMLTLKGIKSKKETEKEIWSRIGQPYNYPPGMAIELMKEGFDVTFRQYPARVFSDEHPVFRGNDEELTKACNLYLKMIGEAVKLGMELKIAPINSNEIKKELKKGNVCLISIRLHEAEPGPLHAITVYGYHEDSFLVNDPLNVISQMPSETMDKLMDTTMGHRMLVVKFNLEI